MTAGEVFEVALNIVQDLLGITRDEVRGLIEGDFYTVFGNNDLTDVVYLSTVAKRKWKREDFIEANPHIEPIILDQFCFRFRSEIALILYPERIAEMIDLLKSQGVSIWNPNMIMTKNRSLGEWVVRYIRSTDGKTDWKRFEQAVNKEYPSALDYTEKREPFTEEFALEACRNIAKGEIEKRGFWNPKGIANIDMEVYSYVILIDRFRRIHDRPDLEHKQDKGMVFDKNKMNTRPNWFAIAEAMGEVFLQKMQLGNVEGERNEQELRTFKIACEELEVEVGGLISKGDGRWSPYQIQSNNQGLYRWFQSHMSIGDDTMSINWLSILSQCSENTRRSFLRLRT